MVFERAVDVERLGARLAAAVAGRLHAAERHVRLAAVGAAVHHGDARLHALRELGRPMDAASCGCRRSGRRASRWRARARPRSPARGTAWRSGPNSSVAEIAASAPTLRGASAPGRSRRGARDRSADRRRSAPCAPRRFARVEAAEHAVELPLVDHRTVVVAVAGPDPERSARSTSASPESVVDRVEHDDAAARRAALAGVAERRQRRPLDAPRRDRHRRRRRTGSCRRARGRPCASRAPADLRDPPPDRRRAGEAHHATSGCSTSGAPASAPRPCTTLSTPAGSPASCAMAANSHAVERRVLGGLEHGGVAADQRRKHLPGDVGDRRVGGDDQAGDAERLAHGRSPSGSAMPLVVVRP